MGVRLVSESGDVFWFTGFNWKRVLRFVELHGWEHAEELDPYKLPGEWNDKYEIIAIARLDHEAAARLAAVIEQGIQRDPRPQFMVEEMEGAAAEIRKQLPTYDPLKHVDNVVSNWSQFAAFARKSAFQVDLTD